MAPNDLAVKDMVRDKLSRCILEHIKGSVYLDLVSSLVRSLRLVYPELDRDQLCKIVVEEQCRALRYIADKTEDKMVEAMAKWRHLAEDRPSRKPGA